MDVGSVFVDMRVGMANFARDLRDARRALREATGNMGDSIDDLADETSRATRRMSGYFKDVSRVVSGIMISQAFYAALNAIESAIAGVFEFSMVLEDADVKYTQLLGSAQESKRYMAALQEFASKTNFNFESVDKASGQIKLMGVETEAVLPILEQIGNAVAMSGGGQDQLKNVTKALRQMYQSPKAQAEELEQFIENGVNVSKYLKEELGLTALEIKNIGDQAIDGKTAIQAILTGMSKDPNLDGAMEKFSKTTRGMMETIKDNALFLGAGVFDSAFQGISGHIEDLKNRSEELLKVFNRKGVGGLFEEMVPKSMQPQLRMVIGGFQELAHQMGRLWQATSPIVVAFGKSLVGALVVVIPVFTKLTEVLANMIGWATQNKQVVEALIFTLIGLRVAVFASTWITKLVLAMRAMTAAAVAARAVEALNRALRVMTGLMTKNKLILVLSVAAAAIMGIALSSEKAKNWLEGLMKRLAQIAGFDIGNVLVPETKDDPSKYLDKYNKDLEDVIGGINDTKEAAEEAKKFLASFDEVFQVPEEEKKDDADPGKDLDDETKDPLDDVPEPPKDDELPGWPDEIMLPPLIWPKLPEFKWPKIPPFEWPTLDFAPVLTGFGAFYLLLKSWISKISALFGDLRPKINIIPNFNLVPVPIPEISIPNMGFNLFPKINIIPEWNMPPLPNLNLAPIAIGIGALTGAFDGLRNIISSVLSPLGSALQGVGGGIGWLNSLVVDLVGNMELIRGITSVVMDLVGNMELIRNLLGTNVDLVGDLQLIQDILGSIVHTVGDLLPPLLGGLNIDMVGDVDKIRDQFNGLHTAITGATVGMGGLALAFAPIAIEWGQKLRAWATENGVTTESVYNLHAGMYAAMVATAGAAWEAIKLKGSEKMTEIKTNVTEGLQMVTQGWETLKTAVPIIIEAMKIGITLKFKTMWEDLKTSASTALSFMKDLWSEHKGLITGILVTIALAIVTVLTGGLGGAIAAVVNFLAKLGPLFARIGPLLMTAIKALPGLFKGIISKLPPQAQTAIANIGTWFSKLPGNIMSFIRDIPSLFSGLISRLPSSAQTVIGNIVSFFKGLPNSIMNAIRNIPSMVSGIFKSAWEGVKGWFGKIGDAISGLNPSTGSGLFGARSGGMPTTYASGMSTMNIMRPDDFTGFSKGGIIGKDSIIRAGERGRREAIVPLDNAAAMAPFAKAVADRISQNQGESVSYNPNQQTPIVYQVGTLIADDRSLKELNNKMQIIQAGERGRGVTGRR